jgi:hypothetical protein
MEPSALARLLSPFTRLLTWGGKWLFLLRERRRKVVTSAVLIARELRYNADRADAYHQGNRSIQSTQGEIRLAAWEKHNWDLYAYAKGGHRQLWEDVAAAYERLQETVDRGAAPPLGDELRAVAARLEAASF